MKIKTASNPEPKRVCHRVSESMSSMVTHVSSRPVREVVLMDDRRNGEMAPLGMRVGELDRRVGLYCRPLMSMRWFPPGDETRKSKDLSESTGSVGSMCECSASIGAVYSERTRALRASSTAT